MLQLTKRSWQFSVVRRFATRLSGGFVVTVGLCVVLVQSAAAQTWGQRLGYPPEAHVLMFYVAELGVCYEANEAGWQALTQGQAHSGAVTPPAPWFDEFADRDPTSAGLDMGLSLTLNSAWEHYRWKPVSPHNDVPSLVDGDGFLVKSLLRFSMNADAEDVKREIDAQISRAREAGIAPTHLLPYAGSLLARPDLTAIYLDASRRHWIPAVLVELTPDEIARFREAGFPLDSDMIDIITNHPLPKLDDLRFVPVADSYEEKRAALLEMVAGLDPGITKIVFYPAEDSGALRRLAGDWQQRVWDAELLGDPVVAEALTNEGVIFTSWREMMDRFEGNPSEDNRPLRDSELEDDSPASTPSPPNSDSLPSLED